MITQSRIELCTENTIKKNRPHKCTLFTKRRHFQHTEANLVRQRTRLLRKLNLYLKSAFSLGGELSLFIVNTKPNERKLKLNRVSCLTRRRQPDRLVSVHTNFASKTSICICTHYNHKLMR